MGDISVPRVIVGSGVAFLGGLIFDNVFLENPKMVRIAYHSFMGAMWVFFREDDEPYLLPAIVAPVAFVIRKRFLDAGSPNLFWSIFFVSKLASDELSYQKKCRSSQKDNKIPLVRNKDWPLVVIASVHQLVSLYYTPRAAWILKLGEKILNGHKKRWLAAISAFLGAGLWSSSRYWETSIKLSYPRLHTIFFVHYLRERPLYYAYHVRTSVRRYFDRLLFNVGFGKFPSYRYRSLTYHPLERHKSEIRLLKLHAGNYWGVVRADLVSIPICEVPPFEAISYRWASGNEVPILINKQRFTVAGEVHKLLQALRYQHEDRMIWLDSICIDQKSDDEKSWQIGFMKDIYSSAEQVVGWIAIMPKIPYLPGPFSSLGRLGALDELPDKFAGSMIHGDLCAQMRAALLSLANEFFFRTWIIQEVTLAKKLIIKFDCEETAWGDFIDSVKKFIVFYGTNSGTANIGAIFHERAGQAIDKIHKMESFRSALENKPGGLPLGELLLGSVDFEVTDSRDRVFGVLGLSTDEARKAIRINYTHTTELMVTINATRYILIKECSFRLMELGGIGYLPSSYPHMLDRPSWTPWWESPVISGLRSLASTCNNLYKTATWAPISILDRDYTSNMLRIQSIFIDKIQILSQPWFALDQAFEARDRRIDEAYHLYSALHLVIQEAFEIVQHAHHPTYKDIDHPSLVWRTICHDSEKGQSDGSSQSFEEDAEQVESAVGEMLKFLKKMIDQGFSGMTGFDSVDMWRMGTYLIGLRHLTCMRQARLCVTKNGYFGVVPAYAEEGDEIWAFLGAPNPFVLRSSMGLVDESEETSHRLVGVCYVDGIMNGELENAGLEPTQVNLV